MKRMREALVTATIVIGATAAAASAMQLSSWSTAQKIDEMGGNSSELNTPSLDGCPIQSPDGLSLYMASNRPGGKGGLDIWMATRGSTTAPWGAPQNLGEPVNSTADDFCPTPVGKHGLFFVSREALPGACGQGDIYYTHRTGAAGWAEPEHLLCAPAGPNSELDEQGPSWVDVSKGKLRGKKLLYFSRNSVTPSVPGEIYVSERPERGSLRAGDPGRRAERPDGERHPAERARGRARGRVQLQPIRNPRWSGHLGCHSRTRRRPVVGAGEPRAERQHGSGRVAALALGGRQAAALRAGRSTRDR